MRSPDLVLSAVPGVRFIFLSRSVWQCPPHSHKQAQAPVSFPGHPVTTEQAAGGGAPGKTDILGLKDFASGQPSPYQETQETPCLIERNTVVGAGGGV